MLQVVQNFLDDVATAVRNDAAELGSTAVAVCLADQPFTPAVGTQLADLNEASFDGYAQINPQAIPQRLWDTARNQWVLRLVPPGGGWFFRTGSAFAGTATIYGYYLLNAAGALIGAELLLAPILLDGVSQYVSLADIVVPCSKSAFQFDPPS
jgi:hypothetical protein